MPWPTALLALLSLVAAIVGLTGALFGVPTIAVSIDEAGRRVVAVVPGTFAWVDGVRAGDQVVDLAPADGVTGWQLKTLAGEVIVQTSLEHGLELLRGARPQGVAALVLAVLGLAALRTRRTAEALAVIAVALAAVPILAEGLPVVSDVALAASVIAPAAWLARWAIGNRREAAFVVLVAAAAAAAWIGTRHVAVDRFDAVDAVVSALRFALPLAVGVLEAARRPFAAAAGRLSGPHTADLLLAAIVGAAVLVTAAYVSDILPLVVVTALAVVALYPRWRQAIGAWVDRVVVGDLRHQVRFEAAEEERARLAREIHDVPLQELSGVIKRLELRPELRDEAEPLRQIAAHLRALATDLRPPVLDDLGLGPALQALVEDVAASDGAAGTMHIDSDIDNRAGYRAAARPPAEVELAVYRAVQEALRNALQHSMARSGGVAGTVAADAVAVDVWDDGVGISGEALRAAIRRGRLGMDSMRERMAAVGGSLEVVRREPSGTVVRLRWPQ